MIKQEKELMLKQIKAFEAKSGIKLDVKCGKPYYKGYLYGISDYLPDNLVIDGGLRCFTKSKKMPKGLKVKGCLDISITDITEIPDDCEFGSLDMSQTKITKLRDNLVLDKLRTYNSSLQQLPKGLKVKETLSISNTDITEIPDDCEFGSLYSQDSKLTKLRDNLTLNYLNVRNSFLTELPKGLKVKGDLDISYTDIMEIPDDCEFGSLYMCSTKITKLRDNLILSDLWTDNSFLKELPKNLVVFNMLKMSNKSITALPSDCIVNRIYSKFDINDKRYKKNVYGEYSLKNEIVHINHPSGREFLHVDGLLSEVIEKKGNVYHVRNGINLPMAYVVTDGNEHWAHGYTLDDANQDLHYKMSLRDKTEYEKLTLDSELTFDEAVACYRVITGACKVGTQVFVEKRVPEPRKEKYTIKEMIELTKNEYGGDTFREFFENNK